jgi:hypothetical protein
MRNNVRVRVGFYFLVLGNTYGENWGILNLKREIEILMLVLWLWRMKWKQKKKGWVAREVEKERVIGDFVRSTSEPLCVEIEFELLVVFCSCLLVGVWCGCVF